MKLHATLAALSCLVLTSSVASSEDVPDAGGSGESLPFLGPVPEEKTKPPTLAEWSASTDLRGGSGKRCTLRRVREWLRFRCVGENGFGVELVAGTATEIALFNKVEEGSCKEVEGSYPRKEFCKTTVEVVFPLRRGDRRFFQYLQLGNVRYDPAVGPLRTLTVGATLSAAWVEDEPSPVVVTMHHAE